MAKLKRRQRRKGEVASRKEAIRNFCMECMGYQMAEIRRCTSPTCWLFPWRLGALDEETINQEKVEVKEEKKAKRESKKQKTQETQATGGFKLKEK